MRTDPGNPATEIGTTDLLENTATSGNFGPGTGGMTLQQAIFAGLVDPGTLVAVREILTPTAAQTAGNIDTAVFRGARAEYDITNNGTQMTVSHTRPADPGVVDGVDTLTNIEQLRFTDQTILTAGIPVPDTAAPAVSVTAPASGATVSDAPVTLSATATDNVGVTGVQFLVDNVTVGAEDSTAPYSATWDIATLTGTHVVTARARDAAGNTATSAGVTVTVANTPPPGAASTPDLVAASDSGTSSTDDITNDHTPTISSTSATATSMTFAVDGSSMPGTFAAGAWSVTTGGLSDGVHVITARGSNASSRARSPPPFRSPSTGPRRPSS